jgi:hypothetical protein
MLIHQNRNGIQHAGTKFNMIQVDQPLMSVFIPFDKGVKVTVLFVFVTKNAVFHALK